MSPVWPVTRSAQRGHSISRSVRPLAYPGDDSGPCPCTGGPVAQSCGELNRKRLTLRRFHRWRRNHADVQYRPGFRPSPCHARNRRPLRSALRSKYVRIVSDFVRMCSSTSGRTEPCRLFTLISTRFRLLSQVVVDSSGLPASKSGRVADLSMPRMQFCLRVAEFSFVRSGLPVARTQSPKRVICPERRAGASCRGARNHHD